MAWFDYLTAPITLIWFLALGYLLVTTVVKVLMVPKGEALYPFLLCWDKPKKEKTDNPKQ